MAETDKEYRQYDIEFWRLEARSQDNVDDFVNHAGYPDGMCFVKAFIERNGKEVVDFKNDKGETAFQRAAAHNMPEMMDYLARQGATTDMAVEGLALAHWLARRGGGNALNWLIAHGTPVDDQLILLAAQAHNPNLINDLVTWGASVEARDAKGNTPLMVASMMGEPRVITALLRNGASLEAVNESGMRALSLAVLFRKVSHAEALMLGGADMDAKYAGPDSGCTKSISEMAAETPLAMLFELERNRRGDVAAAEMSAGTVKKLTVRRLAFKSPTSS